MAEGHEVRVLTRDGIAARLALPQAALGGAKFYTHDTLAGSLEWYEAVKGRGLHSSTFRLNLSRVLTKYTLGTRNHPLLPPQKPVNNP